MSSVTNTSDISHRTDLSGEFSDGTMDEIDPSPQSTCEFSPDYWTAALPFKSHAD